MFCMRQGLADYVAAQIRSEMGRRNLSKAELARRIGRDETWVGRRVLGKSAITMGDLEQIAAALELPVSFFIPSEVAA